MATTVKFIAQLDAPAYLQEVVIIKRYRSGKVLAVFRRYGKDVVAFVASKAQARKVDKRDGRLAITSKMIERARPESLEWQRHLLGPGR